jgi:hypothetical protein
VKTFFLSLYVIIAISVNANQKQNTHFYLIDSADVKDVVAKDKLNQILTDFHSEVDDTTRFQNLLNELNNLSSKIVKIEYYNYIFNAANSYINSASNKKIKKKFYFIKGNAIYQIAFYSNQLGKKANFVINKYREAEKWFKMAESSLGLAHTYNSIAYTLDNAGNINESIDLYNTALHKFEDIKDTSGIATVLLNLASLQSLSKDDSLAKKTYLKSLSLSRANSDNYLLAVGLAEYADFLLQSNQCDSLYQLLKTSINLTKEYQDIVALSRAYVKIGKYFDRCENNNDSALFYYQASKTISEEHNYKNGIAYGNFRIGELNYKRGNLLQAKPYLEAAYSVFSEINLELAMQDVAELLHQIYKEEGLWKKAYQFSQINYNLTAKINSKEQKQNIIRQNFEYEYEKKKSLDNAKNTMIIAISEEKRERQKVIIIGVIIIAVIITIALVVIYTRLKIIKKQQNDLNIAYEKLELQKDNEVLAANLKALQSQMNPHFIFNSLNSIQTLVLKGDIDSSYNYINLFASLMRKTLIFSENKLIKFEDEVNLIKTYLDLEKLRFREDFNYEINTSGISNISVPPMLLQPLLENALKHGLLHKTSDRYLKVNFQMDGILKCTIIDNGVGRKASSEINNRRNKNHKSYATIALNKRFEFLKRKMDIDNIGFFYEDLFENNKPSGTKVVVNIPFVKTI